MLSLALASDSIAVLGVSGFSPLELSPTTWYDPSDLSSMSANIDGTGGLAVDGPVGRIMDKSGNGNHATAAANDGTRPTLRQSGALYYLECDGTDDRLRATFAIAQPWDRLSAIRQISWTGGDFVFGGATANAGVLDQVGASPELRLYDGSALVAGNTGAAIGADVVVTERHNGASSRLAINNGAYTTGDPGAVSPGGVTIAADNGTGAYTNMRFYGLVMKAGAFTDPQIALLRTYLGAKAGISL